MLSICKRCGFENVGGKFFCERCRASLRHASTYDLTVENFITGGDRDAFEILRATGPLIPFIYSTIVKPKVQSIISRFLQGQARPVKRVNELSVECAEILALDYLPKVFVTDLKERNAFTVGDDSETLIVLDQDLQEGLSDNELRALLGHEMAHVKSRHLAYHVTAEVLERGLNFASPIININMISLPVRLALLAWHRESEFSADRGSLIVAGDPTHVAFMLFKVMDGSAPESNATIQSIIEVFNSHPQYSSRLNALREFSVSLEYEVIKSRLIRRRMLRRAFGESCRFCGSPKHIEDILCPSCGRSLA
ncbi:MAG: M48 family metallopeptidase [Candidatus Bathyarchaeia archaeon]